MESSFVEILLLQKHLPSPVRCVSNCDIEKISEIICAFLNDKGGWIVVGIDDEGNYIGVKDDEIGKELQLEIINYISPLPLVYIQKELYKDKLVILVTVVKGSLPPYSYKGRYYINREGLIIVPSPDEISCLMRDSFSVKSGWESIVNLNVERSDLDENLMRKVYNQGLSSSRLVKSNTGLLSTLSELNLVDSYQIKNGAIALFSENTRKFIPQSRIRIQLMSKGKTANHFDDTVILEGNVFYLLEETIDYFKKRLPKQSFFIESETLRIDDYIYPIEVIDEAISNALIHRDYSDSFDEITIFIYSDKIEITNPGQLPDNLIKNKNVVLPHSSILRNPLMAEVFYIAGEMEKTGRGMPLISNKMKELGKKLPEWTISNNRTTLIIYNKLEKVVVNERVKMFLDSHSSNYIFTKSEYIDFFDKKPSKITAQNDIQSMLKSMLCEKIGNGPATKYKIH
jgi:ATP-dependent DNA helicase RecG